MHPRFLHPRFQVLGIRASSIRASIVRALSTRAGRLKAVPIVPLSGKSGWANGYSCFSPRGSLAFRRLIHRAAYIPSSGSRCGDPAAGGASLPSGIRPLALHVAPCCWLTRGCVRGSRTSFQRGRLRALRQAGYHALTFDLGGVGRSGPPPPGFYDADLADVTSALAERAGDLPLHLWGVSAGGYWAHLLLSRRRGFRGAVFEDVAHHLIEWSKRTEPRGWPFYLFFQHCLPHALSISRRAPPCLVPAPRCGGVFFRRS